MHHFIIESQLLLYFITCALPVADQHAIFMNELTTELRRQFFIIRPCSCNSYVTVIAAR